MLIVDKNRHINNDIICKKQFENNSLQDHNTTAENDVRASKNGVVINRATNTLL
jgi:hypothetical protein